MSRYSLASLTVILLLPLLGHLYLAHYSRWIADDFWSMGISFETGGMGGVLPYWYHNWSFYYSAAYIHALVGVFQLSWQVPVFVITLLLIVTIWTVYQIALVLKVKKPLLVSSLMGSLLTFVMVDGSINIFQTFYWAVGVLTYPISVLLLIFLIGLLVFAAQREINFPHVALVAGVVMLAGGFSALYAFYQAGTAFIALVLSQYFAPEPFKFRLRILLGVALFFAVISFAISFSAPGNAIRQEALGEPSSIIDTITRTVITTLTFFPLSFGIAAPIHFLMTILVSCLVGTFFGQGSLGHSNRIQGWILLTTMLLLMAAFFPNSYTSQSSPPARAFVLPHAVLVMAVAAAGYIIGLEFKRTLPRSQRSILLVISSVVVIFGSMSALQKIAFFEPKLRTFAQEWDARDRYLRETATQGILDVEVEPLTYDLAKFAMLETVSEDPKNGMNVHAAHYYDLNSIKVRER